MSRPRILTLIALFASGCSGLIDDPGAAGSGRGGPGGSSGGGLALECVEGAGPPAGPIQLRRLTAVELDHTIRDLLGDDSRPGASLGGDELVAGFAANALAPITQEQVEAWMDTAASLAETAVAAHAAEWLPCATPDGACVRTWLTSFGLHAFRRPLAEDELDELVAFYEDAAVEWGADDALELLLEVILASPELLYHVEIGVPAGEDLLALDAYERASALSYFLWSTMPDDALFEAAATGALDTEEGIEREVERMLADDRLGDTLESFSSQWLDVIPAEELEKDTTLFPEWTDTLAAAVAEEPVRFFDGAIRDEGTLAALLAGAFTYGDAELASLYGAPAPDANGRIELPAEERAGLLTLAGFLAGHSYSDETSWVHRGLFVRAELLCDPVSPPPPDINTTDGNDPSRLTNPVCQGCHERMDPIGHGFEEYDAIGRFMDADVEGRITGAEDFGLAAETFESPVTLAADLAASERVHDCFTLHVFRYAVRRPEEQRDACALDVVEDRFVESGGDVRVLLSAIATSPSFLRRIVSTEGSL